MAHPLDYWLEHQLATYTPKGMIVREGDHFCRNIRGWHIRWIHNRNIGGRVDRVPVHKYPHTHIAEWYARKAASAYTYPVGNCVGTSVGELEGALVGSAEGTRVGTLVGVPVGSAVGSRVGERVGALFTQGSADKPTKQKSE